MSLDVYLEMETPIDVSHSGIFIREDGEVREITRDEWDRRYPEREPIVVTPPEADTCVYTANITNNLNRMAEAAGIYNALWRPEENNIICAKQLVPILEEALRCLNENPARFKKFNPENGWGDYDGLCVFVERYLRACREYPTAKVRVWR